MYSVACEPTKRKQSLNERQTGSLTSESRGDRASRREANRVIRQRKRTRGRRPRGGQSAPQRTRRGQSGTGEGTRAQVEVQPLRRTRTDLRGKKVDDSPKASLKIKKRFSKKERENQNKIKLNTQRYEPRDPETTEKEDPWVVCGS